MDIEYKANHTATLEEMQSLEESVGLALVPNGMVLTDTESQKRSELNSQKEWIERRKEKR